MLGDTGAFEYLNSTERCRQIQTDSLSIQDRKWSDAFVMVEKWEIVLIIVVIGLLAVIVAFGFSFVRKHVYGDMDNVDTTFDAGGNVNAGITATTVIAQWTWVITLLHSSTVTVKYGLSASFFYSVCGAIQVIVFSMLSVQLKIRAPGAKTFLQVIKARFGKQAHIVFCFVAMATNVWVTCFLMMGAAVVITDLVHGISLEYSIILLAGVIGSYTLIGGLGATFYVRYFSTAGIYSILVIFIVSIYRQDNDQFMSVGSVINVFDYVSCVKGPDGNMDNSFLTLTSQQAFLFGINGLVGNFGALLMDQSFWQCSVAAKPKQGVVGFVTAGLAWIAIPLSMSSAMGFAYIALSAEQGAGLLSYSDIDSGLVAPTVAALVLGKMGSVLILVMIVLAITCTGSAEVMAVTSIIVYDIYGMYLKPYRLTTDVNNCVLCGRGRGRMAHPRDKCECISYNHCGLCFEDTMNRERNLRELFSPDYKCPSHGQYRLYNDYLTGLKSWVLVWVTISIIPCCLVMHSAGLGIGWMYQITGMLAGSSVIPIALCMVWERLTATAMVAGSIGGTMLSLTSWLAMASTHQGGLSNLKENTGRESVMMTGCLTAILGGGLITVLVTFIQTFRDFDGSIGGEIWEWTRDIDNPLSPWADKYQKELAQSDTCLLDHRPTLVQTQKAFRGVQRLAIITSGLVLFMILIVWPSAMLAMGVLDSGEFSNWITLCEVWAYLATVLVIILPLSNEAWDIWSVASTKDGKSYTLIGGTGRPSARSKGSTLTSDSIASQYTATSYESFKGTPVDYPGITHPPPADHETPGQAVQHLTVSDRRSDKSMAHQAQTLTLQEGKPLNKHALLEDFLMQYPCWQEAAQRAFGVFQDLTEVQSWWSTQMCFCEELDRPYITGRPGRHSKTQAVLPLLSEEQLTMEDIHAFFKHITINMQPVSELTVAVLELDSTLVYYKMTFGICAPDAPEVVTQRRSEKQERWSRKRRHVAACVRKAMTRINKE